MNPKTTLILAIVLVLAVGALLLTRGAQGPQQESASSKTAEDKSDESPLIPITSLGPDLDRITFDGGLIGTMLQLDRIDGRWWVTAPHRFAAKTKSVDALLTQLSDMKGRPAKEGERGGLVHDSPGLILNHGGEETSLWFSGRLGAGRAVITRVQGEAFTNINTTDALIDLFDELDADTYYDNRMTPPLMPEVGQIEINTPQGNSTLVQEDGRWWIQHEEGKERALETGLPGHLGINNYFAHLEAVELIEKQPSPREENLAAFGLSKPLISVRFVTTETDQSVIGDAYEIHIGTPADPEDRTRYISNGNNGVATLPVFTVDTTVALAFAQDATAFRDPRMIATPSNLIALIELRFGEGAMEAIELFSGQPPTFRKFNGEQRLIPPKRAADLLKALSEARASAYVPINLSKWDKWVSVMITPRLDGKPERLTVYDDPSSNTDQPTMLVHRANEPVALRVPKAAVAGLIDPETLVTNDAE